MKREIKFKRVFQHSETGEITMSVWGNVNNHDKPCDDFSFFKSPSVISGWKPIADIQFTGLKDKNGKEIWEGDVVIFDNREIGGDRIIGEVMFNTDRTLSQLEWGLWTRYGYYKTDFLGSIEVVGNIYENPELLKEE